MYMAMALQANIMHVGCTFFKETYRLYGSYFSGQKHFYVIRVIYDEFKKIITAYKDHCQKNKFACCLAISILKYCLIF